MSVPVALTLSVPYANFLAPELLFDAIHWGGSSRSRGSFLPLIELVGGLGERAAGNPEDPK